MVVDAAVIMVVFIVTTCVALLYTLRHASPLAGKVSTQVDPSLHTAPGLVTITAETLQSLPQPPDPKLGVQMVETLRRVRAAEERVKKLLEEFEDAYP